MTNEDLWLKEFREWLQQRPAKTRAEASPDLFFQSEQGQSSQLPALDAGQRASLLRAMWIDLFDACLRADLPVSVQSWQHRLPAGGDAAVGVAELLRVELQWRVEGLHAGQQLGISLGHTEWWSDYLEDFPEHRALIESVVRRQWLPAGGGPQGVADSLKSSRPGEGVPTAAGRRAQALPGQEYQVRDQMHVQRFLDQGSSKWVYEAQQTSTGRIVALKQCRSSDSEVERQFRDEVRIQSLIDHQNIPPVFLLSNTLAEGAPVFVEKRITGERWSRVLADPAESLEAKLRTLLTVARVLQYAHLEHGVIHRDLKPDNVMVNPQYGEVYLTDWGSAVIAVPRPGQSPDLPRLEAADAWPVGTTAYMSPEQASGRAGEMSFATDVFQLGAILYEILTGNPPYAGPLATRQVRAQVGDHPPVPEGAPGELRALATQSLAFRPAERPEHAGVFAEAIERYLRHQSVAQQLAEAEARLKTTLREQPGTREERLKLVSRLQGLADAFQTNGRAWGVSREMEERDGASAESATAAAAGHEAARAGEYAARQRLVEMALDAGDLDQAELQVGEQRRLEVPSRVGEVALSERNSRVVAQRRRRRRALTGLAIGSTIAALLLGPLWIWQRRAAELAETRQKASETEARLAVTRQEASESEAREERLRRELAEQKSLAQARELRDGFVAQSMQSIATVARDARLDGVATLAELQALPLLRGEPREESLLRVQGATSRTLAMVEQSPRRGMASRVAFVGGGGQFLSADHVNASVRIWSRSTATQVATLEGPPATASQVATLEGHRILNMRERKGVFSSVGGLAVIGPQGQFAITCGIDGRVIRWDLSAQLPIRTETPLRDRQAGWTALGAVNGQLPAEASHIVVGSQAGDLAWLDPETLEERHRVIAAHKGAIRAIALGPGGQVATGDEVGAVLLWTQRNGAWPEQGEVLRPAGGGIVRCLAFAADGAQLLVGGAFPNVEFWSLPERRLVREAAGHAENGGQQIALCAIPLADRGFLTGGTDGRVIEWNAVDGARRREFSFQTTVAGTPAVLRDMALDPAERSLLVSLADGTLEEVEFASGKPRVRGAGPNYRFNTNLIEADLQVGLSAEGGTIVLGSDQPDGALALWQTSDLLACRYVTGLDELRDAEGDFEAPTALALSPKADLIALGTAAGEVVVRTSQGELVWRERLFQDSGWDRMTLPPIVALRFSPAGAQLVALLKDGRLVAWQVQEGRQQWSQAMATEARLLQHISEDLLVTAGESGRIQVWSTAAGELVREWGTPGDAVTALLVSRYQEELVTGNDQGLISTWEVASGVLRKQFAMPGVTRRFAPYSSEVRQPPERSERPRRVLGMAQWGKPTELAVLLGDGSLTLVEMDAQVVLARTLVHAGVAYKFGDRLNWSCEVFLDSMGRLCTVSSDRTIRRWQLGHVRPGTRLVQLGQKQGLLDLEASQEYGWCGLVDGQKLVCQPGNLAQPAWERTHSLEGDQFLGFTQFPDGRIAAGLRRGPALVWNPGDGSVQECPAKRLERFDALAAASPRDNLVATTISPTAVVLWKLDGDQTGPPAGLPDADLKRVLVQFNPATNRTIRVLQFSPNGDQLLAVTELGELVTWKVEGVNLALEGYGHKMPSVKEARYSPDGRRVFQVGAMGVVVWDPRNLAQPVAAFNWHEPALFEGIGLTRHVHSVACSSDGEWLATTGQDGTVRLGRYDTKTDKPTLVATLGLNDLAVAASADNGGATLAEQLRRLSQVTFFVRFSADDKQLVLVSEERNVGLVDLEAVLAWGRGDEPRIWEELGTATGMRMWPDQTIQILDRNRLR